MNTDPRDSFICGENTPRLEGLVWNIICMSACCYTRHEMYILTQGRVENEAEDEYVTVARESTREIIRKHKPRMQTQEHLKDHQRKE